MDASGSSQPGPATLVGRLTAVTISAPVWRKIVSWVEYERPALAGGIVLAEPPAQADHEPGAQVHCVVPNGAVDLRREYSGHAETTIAAFRLASSLHLEPAFCWHSRTGDVDRPPATDSVRPCRILVTVPADGPLVPERVRAWDAWGRSVICEVIRPRLEPATLMRASTRLAG